MVCLNAGGHGTPDGMEIAMGGLQEGSAGKGFAEKTDDLGLQMMEGENQQLLQLVP